MTQQSIRSYVARGRTSPAQRRDYETLLPDYLATEADIQAADILEIGFGAGETLLDAALKAPDTRFVGVEMHASGLAQLVRGLKDRALDNVRVLRADAAQVMGVWPAGTLAEIHLWFPDPWPKRRHHKRRLIKLYFAGLCAEALRPGGLLRMASDDDSYALQMLVAGNHCPRLSNVNPVGGFVPRYSHRPYTRFERRGLTRGHRVYDLCYRREAG